jgi:hypothetical protein
MDLTTTFSKAKSLIQSNKMDEARDMCDLGLVKVAQHRLMDGYGIEDKVERVKIGVWLERFWFLLENNNLLL